MRPMLDDLELPQVQEISSLDRRVLAEHKPPGMPGSLLQNMGRRPAHIALWGVATGPDALSFVEQLDGKFRAGQPLPFTADIVTESQIERVIIDDMRVQDLAGKPDRFAYVLTLREFVEPVEPEPAPPPPEPPPVTTTLIVTVVVEGQPGFDFSTATVTVDGTQDDGTPLSRTLTNRANDVWTEADMPPGQYTARAVVTAPQPMSGSAPAAVRAGQTTQVRITLRPAGAIAKAFVVHFRFDKAFVEPCMRHVLKRAATFASGHADEKLVIAGHTDKSGSDTYNQTLSERRARSVFAYLIAGRDKAAAVAEWNALRRGPSGGLNDSWGVREYQYILQDLGFYTGNVDEQHRPPTDAAVRAFQQDRGLTVDGIVGDATWQALIDAYLSQDNLAVPESQFLRNAKDGCDGGILKWLGCGEEQPLPTTPGAQPSPGIPAPPCAPEIAWRPNRRAELLFVRADSLPCKVPQPVTFNLPTPGTVGSTWCLGPGDPNARSCFITREAGQGDKWLVQPAEPGTVTVRGTIKLADGTPVANARYVLIAPDGEFLHKDAAGNRDAGEVLCGDRRGRPNPIFNRTDANGVFEHPLPTPVGIYTLEIQEPLVARLAGQPPEAAKGNVICKRMDGSSDFDVIVFTLPTSLVFTTNQAPFGTVIKKVQIEGVLNQELIPAGGTFALADLFGTQANSLFRIRADIPGVLGISVKAELLSDPPPLGAAGPPRDRVEITLTRTAGDRFISRPILAIPSAIPNSEITTIDLEVIRAHAGGIVRVDVVPVAGGSAVARVRGRVVHIFASAITGSGVTEARIRGEIQLADRVWAQAGIEIRERGINASFADPGGLLDLDGFDIAPFIGVLTAEEQTLLASNRSAVNSDVNVYYVRSIDNGVFGEGISSDEFAAVIDPDDSGIILDDSTINNSMAHELGHLMIHNGDEHSDAAGIQRPNTNIMHPFDDAARRDLDNGQVLQAIRVGDVFVVFVE